MTAAMINLVPSWLTALVPNRVADGIASVSPLSPMMGITLWVACPFIVGFISYLFPHYNRYLALTISLISLVYGINHLFDPSAISFQLLDSFGVTVLIDALSAHFVVTNAVVSIAVLFYCWSQNKADFFYTQVIILHGSVNAAFICADFISLYVALEVISVAAFLLIALPRTHRSMWVGLRYLLISNTAMLFYLIGTILVYQATHSFAYSGLEKAPREAIALILLGLVTKGGVFISGLWLPQTHAEADTPVSALLSGVVIKTGIFPLVRCALLADGLAPLIALLGVGTAGLGVLYAIVATDTKRTLAASTMSQVGFLLVAPTVAGFYALTHGLAKASLFLVSGNLPSRSFSTLRQTPISINLWIVLAIASLSIAGCPLLAGFEAKALVLKQLSPWQAWSMSVISVGTAIALAKFVSLPFTGSLAPVKDKTINPTLSHSPAPILTTDIPIGLLSATLLLSSGLIVANSLYYDVYTLSNITKALVTVGVGGVSYGLLRRFTHGREHPMQSAETLEHLIGGMGFVSILLLWMVFI